MKSEERLKKLDRLIDSLDKKLNDGNVKKTYIEIMIYTFLIWLAGKITIFGGK
jgi:hypothetical protein